MKNKSENRSHSSQILAFLGVLIINAAAVAADDHQVPEILVRRFSQSNSSSEAVPQILKLTQNGHEKVVQVSEVPAEPFLTLKSDPVKVQSDFKTVDISVLNRQRDNENARKVAIIQEDLQSRIKINEPESKTIEPIEEITKLEPVDPEEVIRKQARVKEDIESRVLLDDGFLGFRQDSKREEKLHYPVKRSDDDYYADEPEPRMTTEAAKEEDSFFSIFESLFGSSDDDSQTKKKAKPEEDSMFKDPEDPSLKENIKTVGDILKPLKPVDEPEAKTQTVYGYQNDAPEYRIVNNFHSSQSHKQGYKPPEPKPSYHNFYRPTEKPFRPYKPYSTNGYEDYDLEEFMDKGEPTTTRVKYVSPIVTTSLRTNPPTTSTSTTTTTTTTTAKTTTRNVYDNKLKFPSVQKKNDYINRNRYQEVKNEVTEKRPEIITERTTFQKPDIKTTTEVQYQNKPSYETKVNENKPQKIQESPNFYNLINLPVRYSTKDTAIPLISTSYANTKIQGMGAHKYEKGANGKYPNHKYDQVSTSTTKRPNYWATKRTSTTEKTTTSFRPSPLISKTTTKYIPSSNFDKLDYDDMTMGLGPEFGGYGSKTGVEVKTQTQTPTKQVSSSTYRETTVKPSDEPKLETVESIKTHTVLPAPEQNIVNKDQNKINIKEIETIQTKTSPKPVKDVYDQFDYDGYPAHVQEVKPSSVNQNYPPVSYTKEEHQQQKNELEYKTQYQTNEYKTQYQNNDYKTQYQTNDYKTQYQTNEYKTQYQTNDYKTQHQTNEYNTPVVPLTEHQKPQEVIEYEYYDYDDVPTTTSKTTTTPTTTTSTTTPKYKIKYPSLAKDKIKTSSTEKVAVVVPSKNHDFYENLSDNTRPSTTVSSTPITTTVVTTTSTTTTTPTPRTTQTTTKMSEPEVTNKYTKTTTQFYKPNHFYKEPAPVFEDVKEHEEFTTTETGTRRIITEKSTTEATSKPISGPNEQESNVNVVLVSAKEPQPNVNAGEKYSQSSHESSHKTQTRPSGSYQSSYDYTTEFTVGVVQGSSSGHKKPTNNPNIQNGHFVASSISTNPYGNDEPFRPISKPVGMTSSFQVVHEETQRQPPKNPTTFQNKRPLPASTTLEEPIHEPHEFIPSPQFHRPVEPKPTGELRPGPDVDYEFEGIQTEPKPGQYVIFSKPQLNPEMNENQLKKKPEITAPTKIVTNAPHYHEKLNQFGQDSQKNVVFKEGQIYQNPSKPKPSIPDKLEQGRPIFGGIPELTDERLSLQLVPPRGTQTEKPFEGNFVVPEKEKQESTINYPRPHWEKNGKPSFLMNNLPNKGDLHGSRLPPLPPQMAPTLIPPSNAPPQRFRRPIQPHIPPMRKNFNEAGTNVKPKPNLPNILPQFRPNTKVGSGPYHRPPGYISSNRRNGVNRYHEKEHGNFPYHIQHPDKDALMHREYDMGPEIIPKFITNRGKLPTELWNSQGMQKRFGQGPMNINSKLEPNSSPDEAPQNEKLLRRLQRTPVTTLQMLKQMPGVKTQKTQISREDSRDPSALLVPPIYKTFTDQPKTEENVYIVYPAKAPQKLQPDNSKVFIVSDTKSHKNSYNFTKLEDQHPLLNPNKRINPFTNKSKNSFPYGFIKPDERLKLIRKQQKENEEKNVRSEDTVEEPMNTQEYKISTSEKDEKIDMNLHMQSNNQWNEVKTLPDSMVSVRNPSENVPEKVRDDNYRFSEHGSVVSQNPKQSDKSGIRVNPPSEYHTSIKDENESAFTLGAVMHTMSEGNRKGQVASVSLHTGEKKANLPKLNVNERISNGKIITVSMPLDVKQDSDDGETSEKFQFQAPFQASSSITSSESHPTNQGWSIVKNPDEKSDTDEGKETAETSTNPHFSFENFKPELIGGFKPIYELPEEPEEGTQQEKVQDREEKAMLAR